MKAIKISNEEQIILIQKIKTNGNEKSKVLLIQSLYPLILKSTKTISLRYCEKEDLISEAVIAILDGFVRNFDPSRNENVAYVAKKWIDAYVKKYLIKSHSLIESSLSRKFRTIYWNWAKIKDKTLQEKLDFFRQMKQDNKIKFDIKEKDILNFVTTRTEAFSISFSSDEIEKGCIPEHAIRSNSHNTSFYPPERLIAIKESLSKLSSIEQNFLKDLSDREKEIWKNFRSQEENNTQNVANFFGITRQRVQQIKKQLQERFFKLLLRNDVDKRILEVFQ